MGTVIIGGGIIGLSTAYYLSEQQRQQDHIERTIHIVDSASSLLLSASGYAGGFLAKDWFSPGVGSLGALSFHLHRQLAEENDGHRNWGYAASQAYSFSLDGFGVGSCKSGRQIKGRDWLLEESSRSDAAATRTTGEPVLMGSDTRTFQGDMLNDDGTPAWITRQDGGSLEVISHGDDCAQVEPRELCEWLIKQCRQRGVSFHLGYQPRRIKTDANGALSAITIETGSGEQELTCSGLVLSAGAWTPKVFQQLFPDSNTKIPIDPLAGYSVVIRSPRYSRLIIDGHVRRDEGGIARSSTCHSIFSAPGPEWKYAPEAFSRISEGGRPEIYVAGLNDSDMLLPPDAMGVKDMRDEEKARDLRRTTVLLTGLCREGDDLVEDDLEIIRQGLCFRPVSKSGVPIVTKLIASQTGIGTGARGDQNIYVAAGHGPWGISLGLGTGMVISEMLHGLKPSADISSLGLK